MGVVQVRDSDGKYLSFEDSNLTFPVLPDLSYRGVYPRDRSIPDAERRCCNCSCYPPHVHSFIHFN